MKTLSTILLLTIVIGGTGCMGEKEIPWSDEVWKKGNLHTHSLWSDGDDYPEMIMDWYKRNGYQFVGLSDHNILQEGEKWSAVTRSPIRQQTFEKYLANFGQDWVEYREDTAGISVKLKELDEYRSKFEGDDFLIIKSEEITSSFEGKPIHVNATNISELIGAQEGGSVAEVMQNAINAVLEQRERLDQPMFPHINHPNFYYAISVDDMMKLDGERFFEVYNGHPAVNNYGDQEHPGTEEMWDMINVQYIADGKPLMYGIATDDSHNYHLFGSQFSNSGRGWVMVNSVELTPEALVDAMERGHFYSSTGVEIKEYLISSKKLGFSIVEEEGLDYTIEFIGLKEREESARVLSTQEGTSAEYVFEDDDIYVRARVTSTKLKVDPFQVGDYEMAWTQPIMRK